MTDQQWKDVIEVNLTGTANTIRAFVPSLIARKSGRIILVVAARLPTSVMKIPWMQSADVAPVAVFLASEAAYRVTGSSYDATAGDSANTLPNYDKPWGKLSAEALR